MILGQDTFVRPNQSRWGTASDGHVWGGDANALSAFSISGNAGEITNSGAPVNAILGASATDSEVLFTGALSSFSNANLGAALRWTDTNNWYKAYITGSTLIVQKRVGGAYTTLRSASFRASPNTFYSLRFRIVGSTLTARAWPAGGAEPAAWMISVSDATFASGFAGLRVQANSVTATITSFLADVPSGSSSPTPTRTATVTQTPTGTATKTASPVATSTNTTVTAVSTPTPSSTTTHTPTRTSTATPSPTATTAGSPVILGQDTYVRPNQSHWGTASDGHVWGGDANVLSAFSISGNAGKVTNTGGTVSAVLGPSATDSEVLFTGAMSSFSNANLGAALRWTDPNNWYKAYITGSSLVVQKRVGGAYTNLASAPFTGTPNTLYSLRFRAVGTTLTARVWPAGGAEPAAWTITVSDATFASGFSGLRVQANSVTATITSFLADVP